MPENELLFFHFDSVQDGSCNGLQHYAALGRDTVILLFLFSILFSLAACHFFCLILFFFFFKYQIGAEAVNLVAGEKPADVYSEIATR